MSCVATEMVPSKLHSQLVDTPGLTLFHGTLAVARSNHPPNGRTLKLWISHDFTFIWLSDTGGAHLNPMVGWSSYSPVKRVDLLHFQTPRVLSVQSCVCRSDFPWFCAPRARDAAVEVGCQIEWQGSSWQVQCYVHLLWRLDVR